MKVPTYKIRAFTYDKQTVYHVVNIATNITQSQWRSFENAMQTMRDLNRKAL